MTPVQNAPDVHPADGRLVRYLIDVSLAAPLASNRLSGPRRSIDSVADCVAWNAFAALSAMLSRSRMAQNRADSTYVSCMLADLVGA